MSMLRSFFEIGTDPLLFDGLYISHKKELCEAYMGKYPVVFLSFKNAEGLSFEEAKYQLAELIGMEAERFLFLLESERLTDNEKSRYRALIELRGGQYAMDDRTLASSLQVLSQLLYKHYGKKTIILIDEYDVPLDKAFQHDCYKEMVALIRSLFGKALKTNELLQFAVLTGCLRVSKESIFTGLNNLKILSIADARFDEQFGFTEDEVKTLLKAYHLETHLAEMKEWYDGYHFGAADIIVETEDPDAGIIIELKYSKEIAGMEKACERAIAQIKERRYDDYLRNDDRQEILIYGMAFCRKKCRITAEKMPRIRS